jgi:hypothetical protein
LGNFTTKACFITYFRLCYKSAFSSYNRRNIKKNKYNPVSPDFDAETHAFGTVTDALYNAALEGRSAKFPRISPDGKKIFAQNMI